MKMPVKKPRSKKAASKRGRKSHEPSPKDRKIVEAMAACVTQSEIAVALGISEPTLRRHYRDELDRGLIIANTKVAGNLFKIACGQGREAVTAAIFWLKTRAGWSEYSPPPKTPTPPKEKPKGKKEQADAEATQPPADDEWADLVRH